MTQLIWLFSTTMYLLFMARWYEGKCVN